MFLRNPKIACSGRNGRSKLSYFQSPTAPNKTASDAMASFKVDSGKGWPCASYAAPPTNAVSLSNFRSSACKTLTASATISVPMPSPGKIAIFIIDGVVRNYSVCANQGLVAKRSASKALILSAWRNVKPISSKPLIRQNLRKAWISNGISSP